VIERLQPSIRWLRALYILLGLFVVYNLLFSYKYNPHIWWNLEWEWSNFLRLVEF
jgi:hypothetical protein